MKLPIAIVDLEEYNDLKNRMHHVDEFLDDLKNIISEIRTREYSAYDLEKIEKWINKIEPKKED